MRHGKHFKRLGRRQELKWALLRNMAISLIEHERISTTLTRAKVVRPVLERLITVAKRNPGSLHARRLLLARLYNNETTVQKIVGPLAERYKDRDGGYLRIIKTGFRKGDTAETALIEFV